MIIHILFLFIFCLVLAALEVQIEGGSGWAENLPTWRPAGSKWYSRLYGKIMSGKELTGYHLMIFSLVFLFLHYPYFTQRKWSLDSEMTTLSFFFIICIVWDFLWFVINPKYDFNDFLAKKVWWHKKWFLHLPLEYWVGFIISAIFYTQIPFTFVRFKEWFFTVAFFILLTIIAIPFADWMGIFITKKNKNGN